MVKINLNKKGQEAIGMSFNFIFALILIVVFIVVAIYGIKYFLNLGDCSNIGMSLDTLQQKVNDVYQSDSSDLEVELNFPGLERICFANLSNAITGSIDLYDEISIYEFEDANMFLLPVGESCNIPFKKLNHVDLNKTTLNSNPLCFDVVDGVVNLRLYKDYYDRAVVVK